MVVPVGPGSVTAGALSISTWLVWMVSLGTSPGKRGSGSVGDESEAESGKRRGDECGEGGERERAWGVEGLGCVRMRCLEGLAIGRMTDGIGRI